MSSGSEKLEYYEFIYKKDVLLSYTLEFLALSKNLENIFDDEDMRRIDAKKESFELLRDIAKANIYTGTTRESVVQRFLANAYEDRIIISEIVFMDNFVTDDGSKLVYLMTDEISLNGKNTTLTSANVFAKVYYRNSYFIEEIIPLDDYETKAYEQNESTVGDGTLFDIQKDVFLAMSIKMDIHRARIVELNTPQMTDNIYKDWYYLFALSDYADSKTIDGAIRKYFLLHEYNITMLKTVAWHEYKREESEDKITLYVSIFTYDKYEGGTALGNNIAIIQLSKIHDEWLVNTVINGYGDSPRNERLFRFLEENREQLLQYKINELEISISDVDGDGVEDEYLEGQTFFDKLLLLDNEEIKQQVGLPIEKLNMIEKQIDDESYDFSFLYD